jgi:hypothetical protein
LKVESVVPVYILEIHVLLHWPFDFQKENSQIQLISMENDNFNEEKRDKSMKSIGIA